MSGLPIHIVDAFASEAFKGNPAAVCLLDKERPDAWLQSIAAEMNLSETAFLLQEGNLWRLRWFTPKVEVVLCGHATVASMCVLAEMGLATPGQPVQFETLSGTLTAVLNDGKVSLDFPARDSVECAPPTGMLEALGAQALYVGDNRMDYLVEVADEQAVRDVKPDFAALSKVECRGVIVTARSSDPQFDFVSRFFAPAAGVLEDPVTGSAHCCLSPYWGQKLGKTAMTGYQVSNRGGVVEVENRADRVILKGTAVTILRGELAVS